MPLHGPPRRANPQPGALMALVAGLQGSLREDPALRLGHTTSRGSRTFTGTLEGVQTFVRPASPNDPITLSTPPKANQRRALNRMRGLGMNP